MINFNNYIDLINEWLDNATAMLCQNYSITKFYKYKLYDNSAKENFEIDENTIVGILHDNGITKDDSSSINTSLQDIDMELLVNEDDINDLSLILNTITEQYKNKPITIDGYTALSIITLSHDEYRKQDVQGEEKASTTVNIKFIIVDGYYLSDKIKLFINSVNIPFNTISSISSTETISDNTVKQNGANEFIANSSVFNMYVEIPMLKDNEVVKFLLNELYKNIHFGEPVVVSLYSIDEEQNEDNWFIVRKPYLVKEIKNLIKIGSVGALSFQLIKSKEF